MEYAGNQRLVRDSLLQGTGLYIHKIWRGKPDIYAPIFYESQLGSGTEFFKLGF